MGADQPARTRALTSPVTWAVLGLVMERPSYGYELAQRLERRYGDVLPVSSSWQIYAALNALEKAGYVEPVDPQQKLEAQRAKTRQPKVRYRATEAGIEAFKRWLADQMHDDPAHGDLLRKLVAGRRVAVVDSVDVVRDLVKQYEELCVAEARVLSHDVPDTPAADLGELIERLVLEARRTKLDAHFSWMEYAHREIDAYERARRDGGR
ncbi:MAG TPA: PadR family transcriptional regulator [Conexibacter sp.]|nr:PadR family transcriptional regulator [Conexibacter sp.]